MKRQYEILTASNLNRDTLMRFRTLFLYSAKSGQRVVFPVSNIQKVQDGVHLISLKIPQGIPHSWVQNLPQALTFNSVISDFSPKSGKAIKRFARMQGMRHALKDEQIVFLVQNVQMAQESRHEERLANMTEEIYASNFIVSADTLDIERKKTFLSELIKNMNLLLKKNVPTAELGIFSGETVSSAIMMVQKMNRPLWLQKSSTQISPQMQELFALLTSFSTTISKDENILSMPDLIRFEENNLISGEKFRPNLEHHIFLPVQYTQQDGSIILVGYLTYQSAQMPTENDLNYIQEILSQIQNSIRLSNDLKISAKAKILDFSSKGLKMAVYDDRLPEKLLHSEAFSFDFHFGYEDISYTIRGRVVHNSGCDGGECRMGVKFLSFRQIPDAIGNFHDGELFYRKSLGRYRSEFIEKERKNRS